MKNRALFLIPKFPQNLRGRDSLTGNAALSVTPHRQNVLLDSFNGVGFIAENGRVMPRRRRMNSSEMPLARFLSQTMQRHRLTIRQAAQITGCAPSVFGAWLKGAFPGAETIRGLKRFCTHFGVTLDYALTGEPANAGEGVRHPVLQISTVHEQFVQQESYEGLAHVRIVRLLPNEANNSEKEKQK